jgi:hypothetical protein
MSSDGSSALPRRRISSICRKSGSPSATTAGPSRKVSSRPPRSYCAYSIPSTFSAAISTTMETSTGCSTTEPSRRCTRRAAA